MKKWPTRALLLLLTLLVALPSCIKQNNPDNKKEEEGLNHLIIEEVFYIGTHLKTSKLGKRVTVTPYDMAYDSYIKIHNPTKRTLYLDGYALASSVFGSNAPLSLSKEDLAIKEKVLATKSIAMFPGSGQEYPIKPGESVLIAAQAVNHKAGTHDGGEGEDRYNYDIPKKALDLSHAPFQWRPKSTWNTDVIFNQEGNAKDMIILYDSAEDGVFKLDGTSMLALVDLSKEGRDKQVSSPESIWEIMPSQTSGAHTHAVKIMATKVPNEWIVDAVNICPTENINWRVANEALDGGAASVFTQYKDKSSYEESDFSRSIVRKHNGKSYEDTNNSTLDFTVQPCSLLPKENE